MPSPISPIRVAKVIKDAIAVNTSEEQEVDFDLGFQDGIEIYEIRQSIEPSIDATAGLSVQNMHITGHLETGTLEDPSTDTDGIVLNSEIIHHAIVTALIDATNNLQVHVSYENILTQFMQRMGMPLLSNSNITLRYETEVSGLSLTQCITYITYRYVRLTEQELVGQLLLRR